MISKSCRLKGDQKAFYLQLDQAASCCRAVPLKLDSSQPITFYTGLWEQEKLSLDQGVELPGCSICWEDERADRLSYRQTTKDMNYNVIELYLTNLCNHMCSYCSPKFSSVWEDSIRTHGVFANISRSSQQNLQVSKPVSDIDYWLGQIEEYISKQSDDSISVKLLGGEPLMQQRNLERLLKLNSNKIKKLIIHTNLNPPNNKFLRWILDTYLPEKLEITVSVDASVDYNHVVRAGFDADKFTKNINLLKHYNVQYQISAVVSALSIFDSVAFIKWVNSLGCRIVYNRMYNPECLDPTLIPYSIRQEILSQLVDPDPLLENILNDTTEGNKLQLIEQHNYLLEYFKRADIDATVIDNALFQRWWTELANNYKL